VRAREELAVKKRRGRGPGSGEDKVVSPEEAHPVGVDGREAAAALAEAVVDDDGLLRVRAGRPRLRWERHLHVRQRRIGRVGGPVATECVERLARRELEHRLRVVPVLEAGYGGARLGGDPEVGVERDPGANHGRGNGEHDGIVGSRRLTEREHVPPIGGPRQSRQAHTALDGPAGSEEVVAQSVRDRLVSLGDGVPLRVVGPEVNDAAPAARELREEDEVQAALKVDLLSVLAAEHRLDRLDEHVGRAELLEVLLQIRVVEPPVGAVPRRVEVPRADAGRHRPHVLLHAQDDVAEGVDDRRLRVGHAVDPVEHLLGRVEEVDPREAEPPHVLQDRAVPIVDELPTELDRPAGEDARERPDAAADAVRRRLVDRRADPRRPQMIGAREAREPRADDRDAGVGAAPPARLRMRAAEQSGHRGECARRREARYIAEELAPRAPPRGVLLDFCDAFERLAGRELIPLGEPRDANRSRELVEQRAAGHVASPYRAFRRWPALR
jgi:hypothetical protein